MAFEMPKDYIEVSTRVADFRAKFPNGRLRQKSLEFVNIGGKDWVVYTAEAWRDENDPAPAQGTAWEPIPGRTPYTKDSEIQNAETAAWGRAIIAAGASDAKEGIASREEISSQAARQEEEAAFKADVSRRIATAENEVELKDIYKEVQGRGIAADFNRDINRRIKVLKERQTANAVETVSKVLGA